MKYRKIILVDDDPDDTEIFALAASAASPEIKLRTESSALDALKMFQGLKKSPDVIFLDYHMPYLDGPEFLKLIRKIKLLEKTPVVLYSGHAGAMLKETAAKFEKVQFLKKQSSLQELIAALQQILKPAGVS